MCWDFYGMTVYPSDPDIFFNFNADPDPTLYVNADPDLAPHQSDMARSLWLHFEPPSLHCQRQRPFKATL